MYTLILLAASMVGQYTGPPPTMLVAKGDGTALFMNLDKDGNPVSFSMDYGHSSSWYSGGAPPWFPGFAPPGANAAAAKSAKSANSAQARRRARAVVDRAYRAKYPRH